MRNDMEIRRIWFDKRYLYGEDAEGRVYRQSLLWYPALASASPEQKLAYKTGFEGFHWPDLGVDVSFESFVYEDAVPTPLQAFFLAHKEINISGFASVAGIHPNLIRDYINGFKHPSPQRTLEIQEAVRKLGRLYSQVEFLPDSNPDGSC
jgi:hypothetical protein